MDDLKNRLSAVESSCGTISGNLSDIIRLQSDLKASLSLEKESIDDINLLLSQVARELLQSAEINAISDRQVLDGISDVKKELINSVSHIVDELTLRSDNESLKNHIDNIIDYGDLNYRNEIDSCRLLSSRAIYVMGFARSSTTITTRILNANSNALILGEANFYSEKSQSRFSDWYNSLHADFNNQVTKTCHAPNFIPGQNHKWWEWLLAASQYYPVIGDKMAFSADHFAQHAPDEIRAFFEARFFNAKYVFLLRNPVQTLLSVSQLFQNKDEKFILRQIKAWLLYIQMWCDWIRTFPNTLTLTADIIDDSFVERLEMFTGLDLTESKVLIKPEERRQHALPKMKSSVDYYIAELVKVYALAQQAALTNKASWQTEQKRTLRENNTFKNREAPTAIIPHQLGQTWAMAQSLIEHLDVQLDPDSHQPDLRDQRCSG